MTGPPPPPVPSPSERRRAFEQRYRLLHRGPDWIRGMETGRSMFLAGVYGALLALGMFAVLLATGRILDLAWLALTIVVGLLSEGLALGGVHVFMGASINAMEAMSYSFRSFGE